MGVREMAQDFSASSLLQIAEGAEHRAKLIAELEPKPWRRIQEQRDAWHTFTCLAAYCREVIKMQEA